VKKKLVIVATFGVGILASDAFADNVSMKSNITEVVTASDNYFLLNKPSGATGQTLTAGTLDFLSKTLTTNYFLDANYSYYKYFGPGAVDTALNWGTPAHASFAVDHTEQLTTYNAGASWTRSDAAITQFAQTGTAGTARGSINTFSGTGGIAHDLSRIASLTLNTVATETSFTDPHSFPSLDVTTTAAWNHVLSSTTTLSNSATFDWFSNGDPAHTQRLFWKLLTGVSSTISPRLTFNGHFGWGFVNAYQTVGVAIIPSGGVSLGTTFIPQVGTANSWLGDIALAYRLLKTTTLSLAASQAVVPLFNGQLQKSDQVSLTLAHDINRLSNLALSAGFSFIPATSSGSAAFGTSSSASEFFSVTGTYAYQLARDWRSSISYTYRQRSDSTGVVGSSLVLFTLSSDYTLFGNPTAINVAQRERARERAQQNVGYVFPGFH